MTSEAQHPAPDRMRNHSVGYHSRSPVLLASLFWLFTYCILTVVAELNPYEQMHLVSLSRMLSTFVGALLYYLALKASQTQATRRWAGQALVFAAATLVILLVLWAVRITIDVLDPGDPVEPWRDARWVLIWFGFFLAWLVWPAQKAWAANERRQADLVGGSGAVPGALVADVGERTQARVPPLAVFGAGGHAKVIMEAHLGSVPDARFLIFDDAEEAHRKKLLGRQVDGGRDLLLADTSGAAVIPAIGQNGARHDFIAWAKRAGRELTTIVSDCAVVSPSATLGAGVFVAAGAVINASTKIGEGVIVNTSASVDHDCVVEACAHIAPGAHLCGGVLVGARTLIGAGAVILPGVRVGKDVTIGAGAVVHKDVGDGETLVGRPARPIKQRSL